MGCQPKKATGLIMRSHHPRTSACLLTPAKTRKKDDRQTGCLPFFRLGGFFHVFRSYGPSRKGKHRREAPRSRPNTPAKPVAKPVWKITARHQPGTSGNAQTGTDKVLP